MRLCIFSSILRGNAPEVLRACRMGLVTLLGTPGWQPVAWQLFFKKWACRMGLVTALGATAGNLLPGSSLSKQARIVTRRRQGFKQTSRQLQLDTTHPSHDLARVLVQRAVRRASGEHALEVGWQNTRAQRAHRRQCGGEVRAESGDGVADVLEVRGQL